MSNIFNPFGFEPSDISFISLGLLLVGVVGAVIAGALLDKTKSYKISMHATTFMIAIATTLLMVSLKWNADRRWTIGVRSYFLDFLPLLFSRFLTLMLQN